MRFCHPFPLTATSGDGEQALVRHKRVDPKSRVQRDPPHFIVFSPRAVFPKQIASPSPSPKNLTEFPFAHNFSKTDLEVL
jgi:hypothetical protein